MKKFVKTLFLPLVLSCVWIASCGSGSKDKPVTPDPPSSDRIKSVLIFGNSIVENGPTSDWDGDHWGMAASCRDSDFVHVLISTIHKIDKNVNVQWANIAGFETGYKTFTNFESLVQYRNPDLLIIKIAENVPSTGFDSALFTEKFDQLLNYIAPDAIKIIVEGFWPWPEAANQAIKAYAEEQGLAYVPLADLYTDDPTNAAFGLFAHNGVAMHPSDKGMRNIAKRIWGAISKYFVG